MDVMAWLRDLGLDRYETTFRDNEIDWEVLPELSEADLEKLGLPLGPRKKLLKAIAALSAERSSASPAAGAEAERRQLTVMFCDLVGSTALSGRLDPEDLSEVMRAYQGALRRSHWSLRRLRRQVSGRRRARLLRLSRRRTRTTPSARCGRGCGLVAAVAQLTPASELASQVRVGIATGLVVVGDLIGKGRRRRRRSSARRPISPPACRRGRARQRRHRREYTPPARRPVRVQRPRRAPAEGFRGAGCGCGRCSARAQPTSRFEASAGSRPDPVRRPRAGTRRCCSTAGARPKRSEGQVVLVSGEPGIGKSRLAQALRGACSIERHTRLSYHCSPYHRDSALHPVIDQLERAAGLTRDDRPEQRLAKLEALLAQSALDVDAAMPLIAALLSIPTGDRYPLLAMTPQRQEGRDLTDPSDATGRPGGARTGADDVRGCALDRSRPRSSCWDLAIELVRRLPVLAGCYLPA